uniref:TSA: Wollemia nobilis Ref_Wollemi_Transcript_15827_1467 transcribed RNA sequence n=1 Tax=Wollemia nobilis TaxID=56998 RepID=A0A0C9S329_9CONI
MNPLPGCVQSLCHHGKIPSSAIHQAALIPSTVPAKNSQVLRSSLFEGRDSRKRCQVQSSHSQRQKQRQLVLCRSSSDNNGGVPSHQWDEHDADYLEAFVLDSELLKHERLREQGFSGVENILHLSDVLISPLNESKDSEADHISAIEYGLLRRFRDPTIFLKICSDSNLLLPIIVGEFAIEKLLDAYHGNERGGRPDQFQLMRNLVGTLGYEVRMVRITERVVSTYYARIFFGKPGEKAMLSVDSRPSDAINLAKRCKVPIYVNKAVVASDAIKLVYRTAQTSGKWKRSTKNSNYDISLDSATEGPDPIAEELNLVRNMLIAVVEERYKDAALWRDKLNKLRMSKQEF